MKLKAINTSSPLSMVVRSNSTPPKNMGTSTKTFFIQCCGRMSRRYFFIVIPFFYVIILSLPPAWLAFQQTRRPYAAATPAAW